MSKRLPAASFARQKNEAYYTPPHATQSLLRYDGLVPFLCPWGKRLPVWEGAAGRGDIAVEMKRHRHKVFASDLAPPEGCLLPVATLDFLNSSGPSGGPYALVTNPPYGVQNREALKFLNHGLSLMQQGLCHAMALLLPFEFDATQTRNDRVGSHPYFLAKVTVKKRIRWLNLPQSEASPMGCHSWFIYSRAKFQGALPMVVL